VKTGAGDKQQAPIAPASNIILSGNYKQFFELETEDWPTGYCVPTMMACSPPYWRLLYLASSILMIIWKDVE